MDALKSLFENSNISLIYVDISWLFFLIYIVLCLVVDKKGNFLNCMLDICSIMIEDSEFY